MKKFGYILVAIGLALLIFFISTFFTSSETIHSPIPEGGGVRVIYITPSE